MSVNSSIQQLSGGVASALAGLIVVQTPSGRLERYEMLGYVVVVAMGITLALMYSVHKLVERRAKDAQQPVPAGPLGRAAS